MYDLLARGIFCTPQMMFRNQSMRDDLLDQHRAINNAIQSRNPVAARAAVEQHMAFIQDSMAEQIRSNRQGAVAQQRLQSEKLR